MFYSKGTTHTSNLYVPHTLVSETCLVLTERPKLYVPGGDVEVLRHLQGKKSGNSTELLTYIVELGYNVMKWTEYFVSH